jgi:hypothetical protein
LHRRRQRNRAHLNATGLPTAGALTGFDVQIEAEFVGACAQQRGIGDHGEIDARITGDGERQQQVRSDAGRFAAGQPEAGPCGHGFQEASALLLSLPDLPRRISTYESARRRRTQVS